MTMAIAWATRYLGAALVLLPVLWIVLTISPNLNPERSLWVLVNVYLLFFLAITGFRLVFEDRHVFRSDAIWWSRSSGVWWTAAAFYIAAAVFSSLFINLIFGVFVVLGGLVTIGFSIFYTHNSRLILIADAFLNGLFLVLLLYLGINDFPISNVLTLKVIAAGILASVFYYAFDVLYNSKEEKVTAWILLGVATSGLIGYLNYFLANRYMVDTIAIIALSVGISSSSNALIRRGKLVYDAIRWTIILVLNIYSFYLFADYTQILQLI